MPDGIPEGITRDDIIGAISAFDADADHEFGPSTGYDLLFNGKRFPPKAIVGLAARRVAGRTLTPYDFKGGEGSRCFRVLRGLGFDVVLKNEDNPEPSPARQPVGKTYILTWNPNKWTWPEFDSIVERSSDGEPIDEPWSAGNTKSIAKGERVFLLRQAVDRGIIGSGWTTSKVYQAEHWDGSGTASLTVGVTFDRILAADDVLPTQTIIEQLPDFHWNHLLASGQSVPSQIAAQVESLWQAHLSRLGYPSQPDEVVVPGRYIEGATRLVAVNVYERNPKARQACIDHFGFGCSVCGFDFEAYYGDIGEEYIHVHHLKDLASIGAQYEVNPIRDLRPVCPNCHAMLHTDKPAMSIERLREIIEKRRG